MTDWGRAEAVSRYGFILDRIGLSGDEVTHLHAGGPVAEEPAVFGYESVDERVPTEVLHERLLEVLVGSTLGFEAPRRYWNRLPTMQVQAVLEPHDLAFLVAPNHEGEDRVSPPSDRPTTLGVRHVVGGTSEYARFEYPETPLGAQNYPALVDVVQRDLLADTNLRFVRLVDDGDCWRFVLVERERLTALRSEFGERIELGGRPLLAAHQPAAYRHDVGDGADDGSGHPPELVATGDGEGDDETTIGRPFDDAATASFADLEADADAHVDDGDDPNGNLGSDFDHGECDGPTVDELAAVDDPVEAVEAVEAEAGETTTTRPSPATELDELFADLDERTLEADSETADGVREDEAGDDERSASEARTTGDGPTMVDVSGLAASATVDWSVDRTTDEPAEQRGDESVAKGVGGEREAHELDGVFDELERDAAMSTFAGSTTADDDRVTSADLLDAIDHENAGDAIVFEDGFVLLDPDELARAAGAIADAAAIGFPSAAPNST